MTARSRRAFLARLAASIAAPSVLASCGRREPTGDSPAAAAAADRAEAPPAGPALPAAEPVVRVRVLARGRGSGPVRIGADGDWIELRRPERVIDSGDSGDSGDGASAAAAPPVVLHGPVEIRTSARGWSILDGRGFRPTVRGLETLELRRADAAEDAGAEAGADGLLAVGDDAYPGFVRIVSPPRAKQRQYDVINHVPLERYLPRVLEGELYSHWHEETFAAQAVAARSFACAEASYRSRGHFDVTNTALSQMYAGAAARGRAREAVARTRGVMLAYERSLVPGYYSSCCGGLAADAADAISDHAINLVPPLRGRSGPDVCTDAGLFSWTIVRPRGDVAARLAAFGRRSKDERLAGADDVSAIEVAAYNPHGRPRAFRVVTPPGERVELDAETLRRAIDASAEGLAPARPRLWSSNVAVSIEGETVRFDGAGHGHGVGMCQHGAETLARAGSAYEAILRWYYPEVELLQAYA